MKITVLIAAHDHMELIRFAIACVMQQTHADWELFVVGDGAHPETIRVAREAATEEPRIRIFDFRKGRRNGEAHRQEALRHATGEAVCYLADDDLWMPDHLEVMCQLLADHDFAHTCHTTIGRDQAVHFRIETLDDPAVRARMASEDFNIFGPTCVGHRLSFYRDLPEGWAPAPWDVRSDLYMWRKVLQAPGARLISSPQVTTLHLGQIYRANALPQTRYDEMKAWYRRTLNPGFRDRLRSMLVASRPGSA